MSKKALHRRLGEDLLAGRRSAAVSQAEMAQRVRCSVSKSSAHDVWTTPADFLERLYPLVGGRFTLDPCSPTRNPTKAPVRASAYYTREDDGLSLEWTGTVYMNPPYGRGIGYRVSKARREVREGRAASVLALAAIDALFGRFDAALEVEG